MTMKREKILLKCKVNVSSGCILCSLLPHYISSLSSTQPSLLKLSGGKLLISHSRVPLLSSLNINTMVISNINFHSIPNSIETDASLFQIPIEYIANTILGIKTAAAVESWLLQQVLV